MFELLATSYDSMQGMNDRSKYNWWYEQIAIRTPGYLKMSIKFIFTYTIDSPFYIKNDITVHIFII